MIVSEGKVLLEYVDIVNDRCLTKDAFQKSVQRGYIKRVRRGGEGHSALFDWASLPERYKDIVRHYLKGDPQDLAPAQQVERHLVTEQEDINYLWAFRGSNGYALLPQRIDELRLACRIVALLAEAAMVFNEGATPKVMATYGMGAMQLKEAVCAYVRMNRARLPKKFPATVPRLEKLKRAYLAARKEGLPGAAGLLHGCQGNANPGKVKTPEQVAVMRRICARSQNYGYRRNAKDYNTIAAQQGWPTITGNTVKNFLRGLEGRTATLYAKGMAAYQDKYGVVIHRSAPTCPTYLWVHDGTTYELLYQKEVGGKRTFHHRKTVVVVLDPHTWYPVGYAIGDEDTVALAKAAMRDAVRHMHHLTGQYILPWQVQSDRLGFRALGEWYAGMDVIHTPAAAHNSRAKVIEPWFRQHNDTYVNRFPNWSGHNVTSLKRNQPNPDALNQLRHSFPTEAGVVEQIRQAIGMERADKVKAFTEALLGMPQEELRMIGHEKYLMHFGERHPWTNELTNRGLCPTIQGETMPFNLLQKDFQQHVGSVFQLFYDPEDLGHVLAIEESGKARFLVPQTERVPMALKDHSKESRRQLADTQAWKLDVSQADIDRIMGDPKELDRLAQALIVEGIFSKRLAQGQATGKTDDLVIMTPEEEAVTKNYLQNGTGHKAALKEAREEAYRELTEEEIARRAIDML